VNYTTDQSIYTILAIQIAEDQKEVAQKRKEKPWHVHLDPNEGCGPTLLGERGRQSRSKSNLPPYKEGKVKEESRKGKSLLQVCPKKGRSCRRDKKEKGQPLCYLMTRVRKEEGNEENTPLPKGRGDRRGARDQGCRLFQEGGKKSAQS